MHIELKREGGIAFVRLNRPEALNALTEPMKDDLAKQFAELARDRSVRAVVLCATGRGFCAGGDVTTMGSFTIASGQERLKNAHRMIISLASVEKPVIASVRGAVAGIGWSMAMACDQIVASETAFFSQAFKNIGVTPDGGSIYFLTQNLGLHRAKELVLSGRRVKAAEARELGLVARVVPDEKLEAETQALAEELANGPTIAYGFGKKLFKHMFTPTLETFLDAESWAQGNALMTEDHKEGARAFQEKRKPAFKGE